MKKLCYVLLATLSIALTGCGASGNAAAEPETITGESIASATASGENAASSQPRTNAGEKSYFGSFQVTSCLGTAGVYAMSEEEIDGMTGATVSYQSDSYSYNGNEVTVSGYEEEPKTAGSFEADFNASLSSLGLSMSELTAVTASAEENLFGSTFCVIDGNTLMLCHEGVFFQAVRR